MLNKEHSLERGFHGADENCYQTSPMNFLKLNEIITSLKQNLRAELQEFRKYMEQQE